MKPILDFIVDILSQPAILVALIAFIGLIVQKSRQLISHQVP
ncbi:hypothetical protein G5S33_00408 [Staphylococcus cohnii subsp. cohnii]|nr:hypothetical protein [Staphylococcus cohnii subsp. barensis]